jgi:hypothetical protein
MSAQNDYEKYEQEANSAGEFVALIIAIFLILSLLLSVIFVSSLAIQYFMKIDINWVLQVLVCITTFCSVMYMANLISGYIYFNHVIPRKSIRLKDLSDAEQHALKSLEDPILNKITASMLMLAYNGLSQGEQGEFMWLLTSSRAKPEFNTAVAGNCRWTDIDVVSADD